MYPKTFLIINNDFDYQRTETINNKEEEINFLTSFDGSENVELKEI